jgi:hypothetical protein
LAASCLTHKRKSGSRKPATAFNRKWDKKWTQTNAPNGHLVAQADTNENSDQFTQAVAVAGVIVDCLGLAQSDIARPAGFEPATSGLEILPCRFL